MPPKKAGPASSPPSPPPAPITDAPFKRKLPGFIRQDCKQAKKRVSFDGGMETVETLESIKEVGEGSTLDSSLETVVPWVEVGDSKDEEILMLENMYDVYQKLNEECEDRKLEVEEKKAMSGGPTPPSSQDSMNSGNSNMFDLSLSAATDYAESSEIFDFIFKYIPDWQLDIYRRIGTGNITRGMAEDFLMNAPRILLGILEFALVHAERKVNQFSA
jgi:hypothetical protein